MTLLIPRGFELISIFTSGLYKEATPDAAFAQEKAALR
jgi:hypothetical protein